MTNSKYNMSSKLMVIIVLGIAFIAGYLVSRERYKPQINNLSTMVIERDDKITYLNNLRNRLVLTDGQLTQNIDGDIMVLDENVLLSDGSRVSLIGIITRPNGDVEELEEGDSLFMDGTIMSENDLVKSQEEK